MNHQVTEANIDAIYGDELASGKTVGEAYHGTRTRVHALLQEDCPPPAHGDVAHLSAPSIELGSLVSVYADASAIDHHHHAHQAAHHVDLWAEADRLIHAAGISEGGR